jgi:magnesium chelatase family protein
LATHPCLCGHLGNSRRQCRCTPAQIQCYRAKISGPLLDRIDVHLEAPALSLAELRSTQVGEPSAAVRQRVQAARDLQRARFAGASTPVNARMTHAQIRQHCAIDASLGDLLQQAMEKLSLSARAYDRILKVARTIADLAGVERIGSPNLLEAIQYRTLDRSLNG